MRLLIVDDEKLVRYHIRCLVAEADSSIEIVEAENGRELVELASARRVDAALVDIRMPKLDGLQALKELTEKGRAIPWAVLSSHSEFEYAKRALELGALGYALKPPSKEEVAELVGRLNSALVRARFDRAASFERDWRRLALSGAVAVPSAAEGSLFSAALLAADGIGTAEEAKVRVAAIAQTAANRSLRHAEEGLCAVALQGPETAILEVGLCAEATGESGPDLDAMRLFWNELALAAATAGGCASLVSDLGDSADCEENRGRAARITIIHAESAEDPSEARSGLEAVRLLIDRRALLNPGAIEAQAATRHLTSFGTADLEAAASLAHSVAAVMERDGTALREAVSSFATASRAGIGERALDLLRRFIERTLPGKSAAEAIADPSGAALLHLCEKAMELSGGASPSRPGDGDTIAAVEEFVRRRFAERLSLAETARIFGLTPNYLSALFHRRIGMTFVEYATELRLIRARELLRSGKSVKEAAWAVGYGSERHFARLYRQRFGSPPVEEKRARS